MIRVSVFDTKSFDREYLVAADKSKAIEWVFHDFRLIEETVAAAEGSKVVCVFVNDKLDSRCIDKLKKQGVELIALRCAGFNNLDVKAAQANKIAVVRVPAYSPNAVAEHTIALLLALNRKIHRAYNRVREFNFSLSGLVGFDIFEKTVGVIGTGKIGRITAQILHGFGANVLAYDPFPDQAWAMGQGVEYVSFDRLLSSSDVITLHSPLMPETFHMIDELAIAKMKRGAVIVNTSRGKLIDTTALIAGLKSGQIGGVAMDVYEEEEGIFFHDLSGQILQDDELAHLLIYPNVLITAHQAFLTHEALTQIAVSTTANIIAYGNSEPFLTGTQIA
jgi:D-lactate dehydrogenase